MHYSRVDNDLGDSSCIVLENHIFSFDDFIDFNGSGHISLLKENATALIFSLWYSSLKDHKRSFTPEHGSFSWLISYIPCIDRYNLTYPLVVHSLTVNYLSDISENLVFFYRVPNTIPSWSHIHNCFSTSLLSPLSFFVYKCTYVLINISLNTEW